jgi:hypothetical protein
MFSFLQILDIGIPISKIIDIGSRVKYRLSYKKWSHQTIWEFPYWKYRNMDFIVKWLKINFDIYS